ncbi:DegV family protein [Bacillus sp. HNG]|uniref:DegV family protein n=1 Tax=Bacillus sp. HNG TaxID=2293325 RepID=UPI000E2FC029|nr:DegV family protein [Bacillus sp. HNG]RFB15431.1 DegV family protein [Bacillus sp. HNG]
MIKLVTDSSADLPIELLQKYDITVVPMNVSIEGKDFREGVDLTPQQFFKKMFASAELPKTSQPSPATFAEAYSRLPADSDILCLTISSGLSGTYQSATMGKDLTENTVTVFDTLAGSLGHGMQILRAAELAEKGHSVDEIITNLTEYRENMNIYILLDTLENIVKGGRLSKFQGSLAKLLNIKVLLQRGNGGTVEIFEKIRGKKKSQKRLLEVIKQSKPDFSETVFGITHTGNIEEAEALKKEIIAQCHPKDVMLNYMGATMGTYAGKGGMIISY